MKIHSISQKNLNNAANLLLKGGIVAFPTETVYGLGALASNDEAVNRVYKIKKRPKNNPLIVHIHSIEHVKSIVQIVPDYANKLIEKLGRAASCINTFLNFLFLIYSSAFCED